MAAGARGNLLEYGLLQAETVLGTGEVLDVEDLHDAKVPSP